MKYRSRTLADNWMGLSWRLPCGYLACFPMSGTDCWCREIVSEYDQEIPQSQTADYPVAPRGRAAQPPRDTRKTN